MTGLAGLGSFAGGMAQGLERGQFMSLQEQRAGLAQAAEERLRQAAARQARLDARQDALLADDEAARMAGSSVINDAQAQYAQQWNQQQAGPGLGGGPVQAAAMPPFQPDDKLILKASKAYYNELFRRGRTEEAVKAWSMTEARRAQMRGVAAQQVLASLQMGGDVKGAMMAFGDTFDNGHTVQDVKAAQGPDGKMVYTITRKDDAGNETQPMQVPAEKLAEFVQSAAMDPQAALKASIEEKIRVSEHLRKVQRIQAEGDEARESDDRRTKNSKDLEQFKADRRYGLIAAEGEQARLTKAMTSGSDAAAERQTLLGQATAAAQAVTAASNRLKEAQEAMQEASYGTDAEQRAAQRELREARQERDDAMARRKSIDDELTAFRARLSGGLSDAHGAKPQGKRIKMDANGNVVTQSAGGLGDSGSPLRALPPGAKQIGTSKGRPVYEGPDGERYVAD